MGNLNGKLVRVNIRFETMNDTTRIEKEERIPSLELSLIKLFTITHVFCRCYQSIF